MYRLNKNTLLGNVRANGSYVCYIAPSKVNVMHVKYGWHLGMEIRIVYGRDKELYVVNNNERDDFTKLNDFLSNYEYYNCNLELGKVPRYWQP